MPRRIISRPEYVAAHLGTGRVRELIEEFEQILKLSDENPAKGYAALVEFKKKLKHMGVVPDAGIMALDKYRRGRWTL